MTWTDSMPLRATCLGAGLVLAGSLGAVAVVRRDRPLHAFGATHTGTLTVSTSARVGVPLLDDTGRTPVVVRTSRAMSLSRTGPDVMGLAVRADDRDLLFASTGTGRIGRYLLAVHRHVDGGPLTTLLPVQTPSGLLQLALEPRGSAEWRLSWSRPGQARWTPIGVLHLDPAEQPDPGHFDPTGRPPVGMTTPGWVRALRAPAYRVARTLVRTP